MSSLTMTSTQNSSRASTPMTKTIIADQVFNRIPRYPANGPFNIIQDVLSAAHWRIRQGDPKRLMQWLFGDEHTPKCSERDDALAPEYLTCGPMRCLTSRPLLAVPGALPQCLTAPSEAGAFPSSSTPFDDHSRLPVASHPSPPITGTGDIHPLPLPLSLLQSLTPMTLSSLVTGTARELEPAATPSAACLGTTSTAVLLRKTHTERWPRTWLQASVDAWPSTNKKPSRDSTPLATQRDAPPHATGYSFEIVVEPAISTGLRNEEGFKALPLPEKSPSPPPIFEGKLAAILQIHKELIETAFFERADDAAAADPVAVLGFVTKQEAEFSLPLQEIDVLVNNHSTEASALGRGSQIVVIYEELENEVGARVNMRRTEGANGSTSAKDLDIPFPPSPRAQSAVLTRGSP
ncbi:hypothetical protein EDB85DRAFT_2154639 [Lactarius pseudohatsudake]|nr:hypothetical protein EDB85DRAFT_2154639 [Lactarius pseudohatsudake]